MSDPRDYLQPDDERWLDAMSKAGGVIPEVVPISGVQKKIYPPSRLETLLTREIDRNKSAGNDRLVARLEKELERQREYSSGFKRV